MQRILRDCLVAGGAIGGYFAVKHIFDHWNSTSKQRKQLKASEYDETSIRPPFPKPMDDLLQAACLCQMAVLLDDGTPHLCLMNFTYVPEEEVIILTTRRNTTKYQAIEKLDLVTLLIHDFPIDKATRSEDSIFAKTHSITLYGNVTILSGDDAEQMRQKHLQRHGEDQAQFIIGKDIAVLQVEITSAKLCNIKDEVTIWDATCVEKN